MPSSDDLAAQLAQAGEAHTRRKLAGNERLTITLEALKEYAEELNQRELMDGTLTLYWYPHQIGTTDEVWLVVEGHNLYSLLCVDQAQAHDAFWHPGAYDGWMLHSYA